MMKKIVHLVILNLFLCTALLSQTATAVDLEEMDQYFTKMVADWDIPSAAIGIVKDGKLIFTGNYGVKEIGSD